MRKFNADDQLFEPVEVTIDGVDYSIKKVTEGMMAKLQDAGDSEDHKTLSTQLSILLNVDHEIFINTDIRKLSATTEFIMKTFTGDIEVNPTKTGSEITPQ